jgi:hypothetical protein
MIIDEYLGASVSCDISGNPNALSFLRNAIVGNEVAQRQQGVKKRAIRIWTVVAVRSRKTPAARRSNEKVASSLRFWQ